MSAEGDWDLVLKTPMGEQRSSLTLKAEGAALSGRMSGSGNVSPVENGRISGDAVSWSSRITSPMPLTLEFEGVVQDDRLSGKVKLGAFGSAAFTGVRA